MGEVEETWLRGCGDVYLATVTKPVPRSVAVKYCESPSPFLQKEYRVLRHFLNSPNIVQCYGESITIEDGVTNHNLLLEYAAGGNLLNLINTYGGEIPESDVIHTRMIVQGLCVIHEKGYIHCIKPQNILVSRSNQPASLSTLKIADFGLAEEPGEETRMHSITLSSRYFGYVTGNFLLWTNQCCNGYMVAGMYHCRDEERNTSINGNNRYDPPTNVQVRKDFLKRCFAMDPNQRWTAKMLLTHEFLCPNYVRKKIFLPHAMMHQNRNALNQLSQVEGLY
ncbi:hypothetical protein F3Y22_tig00001825pilonHSYRG00076 [Hibiscus syriacus]|uniref:Protein kinase domain-containing protein n=1 Tax=Hibiscus syriacus TaxID=106335 RepID=A0A6A3CTH1_HIBSY|nr:cell division control protein 7-like [Hibiscus syriacus]KAE8732563.1 hypothetical protein F3Y22_tig00001825pilonHSYRG00076 [Hibiscus syriacus]